MQCLQRDSGNVAASASSGPQSCCAADLPIPKILRVRALKSATWVLSESMLVDLCVSIYATQPAERMLTWLFKQQKVSWLQRLGVGVLVKVAHCFPDNSLLGIDIDGVAENRCPNIRTHTHARAHRVGKGAT